MNPATIPLTFFRKASGSISGPHADVVRPAHVRLLDYEVEIGLVIGRTAAGRHRDHRGQPRRLRRGPGRHQRRVRPRRAAAPDPVLRGQVLPHASPPSGPPWCCWTADELKRFSDLRLRLSVNGELRQDACVGGDMIYPPVQALQSLARFQHLDPGDLVLTGTPVGTALSAPAKPVALLSSLLPPARKWQIFLGRQREQPALPAGRRRHRGRGRHRRRRDRPRRAAHHRAVGPMSTEPTTEPTTELLWPEYATPADLAAIESVPLQARGLPETTYALLHRAATLWPDRVAVSVLPDAERWQQPVRRTYAQLLADVHRYANLLHELGVRRTDAVALMAPNCAELITATLAAQLAGIAAPLNGALVTRASRRAAAPLRSPRAHHGRARARARHLADRPRARRRRHARHRPGRAAHRGTPSPAAAEPLPLLPGVTVGYLDDGRPARRPVPLRRHRPPFVGPRGAVPHRRHHRRAEAGRAHPRHGGGRRLDAGRLRRVHARVDGVRRAAAVPRQRPRRHRC